MAYAALITWNYALADETGFLLQRSTNSGSTWTVNYPQPVTTSYLDTAVVSNGTYWYRIAATNAFGTGSFSNIGSVFIPGASPPEAPLLISVESGSAILNWTSSGNPTSYVIHKSLDGSTYNYLADDNPTPHDLNLVTNSGFETGDFSEWTLVQSEADTNDGETTIVSGNTQFTHSGTYGVSIGSFRPSGSLLQTLNTVSGSVYVLSFWLNSINSGSFFNVYWDGVLIDNIITFNLPWTQYSYNVTASESISELTFEFKNDFDWFGFDDVNVIKQNVLSHTDSNVTSSAGDGNTYWYKVASVNASGTSSFSNTASINFQSGGPPPEAPEIINLQVKSGSAILNWQRSGSQPFDHYSVRRSVNDIDGTYSEFTTSFVETATDFDLLVNNTYYYKVAAIQDGQPGTFSNIALLNVIPCNSASFQPQVHYGYIGFNNVSTYRNQYGVIVKLEVPTELSASMWLRSPDFDPYLTVADSNGVILVENNWDGWTPGGDNGGSNAALTYNFPSGTYDIEVSILDDIDVDIVCGRWSLSISPGARLECTWSNASETSNCDYIPTSDVVVVGEQGSHYIFFNTNTGLTTIQEFIETQGHIYSPIQDRVFGWVYELGDGSNYTMSIAEFDNTGSLVNVTRYPRKPTIAAGGSTISSTGSIINLNGEGTLIDFVAAGVQPGDGIFMFSPSVAGIIETVSSTQLTIGAGTGSTHVSTSFQIIPKRGDMDFNGYMAYDKKRDHILFYGYNYPQRGVIWDCATRTTVTTMSLAVTSHNELWGSCYSEVNDTFFLGVPSHFGNSFPMMTIDAGTYAVNDSPLSTSVVVDYISASALIITRNNEGKVAFCDPITQTVVATINDLPSGNALYEAGARGDQCSNTYICAIDPRSGEGDVTNHPCMAFIDRNTYLPSNWIVLTDDSPGGFSPDGWYQYSVALSEKTSRIYSATVTYDTNEGRLYSLIPTSVYQNTPLNPWTASAIDTASCITYSLDFKITSSTPTDWVNRAYPSYVTVNNAGISGSVLVSDYETMDDDFLRHNRHNWFFRLDGSTPWFYDWTGSYTHLVNNARNAIVYQDKYIVMSDGNVAVLPQTPITASEILVFDISGSLLQTIPLTFGGIDYGTDGTKGIWVYEMDSDGAAYFEMITGSNFTSLGAQAIQNVNWDTFGFYTQTISPTSSMNNSNPWMFGKIMIEPIPNNINPPFALVVNNLTGSISSSWSDVLVRVGTNGNQPYIYYNWRIDLTDYTEMGWNHTSSYGGWMGSFTFCPINKHIYIGAWGPAPYYAPLIIETNLDMVPQYTYDLSPYSGSLGVILDMKWNPKKHTIQAYSSGIPAPFLTIDPIAHTVVCTTDFLYEEPSGSSPGVTFGIDSENGSMYLPQRFDGDFSALTGSVKIYTISTPTAPPVSSCLSITNSFVSPVASSDSLASYFIASTEASVPRLLAYDDIFSGGILYMIDTTDNSIITAVSQSINSNFFSVNIGCYASSSQQFFVSDLDGNMLVYDIDANLTNMVAITGAAVNPPVYDKITDAVYSSYQDIFSHLHIVKHSAVNGSIIDDTDMGYGVTYGYLYNSPGVLWIGGIDGSGGAFDGEWSLRRCALPSLTTGSIEVIDLGPNGNLWCVKYSDLTGKLYVGSDLGNLGGGGYGSVLYEIDPSNANIDYTYDLTIVGEFGPPRMAEVSSSVLVTADNDSLMLCIDIINHLVLCLIPGNYRPIAYVPSNGSIYANTTGSIQIYNGGSP